jgi:hypothetical protein
MTMLGATRVSLPGRRLAVGPVLVRRQEQLVLAEDPAGQVGEDEPGLDAGDPGPHRGDHRPRRPRGLRALLQPLDQRFQHDAEPVDVRSDPAGPVHHRDEPQRAVAGCGQAGDLVDRLLDGDGKLA